MVTLKGRCTVVWQWNVWGSFGRAVSQAFPENWRAFMISFVHLEAGTESSAP